MIKNHFIKKNISICIAFFCIGISIFSAAANLQKESLIQKNPWWNTEWNYRQQITIDHTNIITTLENFPVLIAVTSADFISHAQSDGDDFVFTNTIGTEHYNHEIESYDSTTGKLIVWVLLPEISSTQNTTFYLYYGNAECENQQHPEGTWDEYYLAVHHFEETAGTMYDSTTYDNNGTPNGDITQDCMGKINGAVFFDGTDDYILLPQVYSTETQFTMETWIYTEPGARYIFSQRIADGVMLQITEDGEYLQWYINSEKDGFSGISLNTWYYVVLTYDGTTARLYKNAETPKEKTCNPPVWPAEGMYLGDRSAGERFFHGFLDEVRLSNIARSSGWINTCYLNQMDPDTFYIIGAEEQQPSINQPPEKPCTPQPEHNAVDASINQTLSVFVSDPNDDILNVLFYDASDDSLIDADLDVPSGSRAEIIWRDLEYYTVYSWYAVAQDAEYETKSDTWMFTTEHNPDIPPTVTITQPLEKSLYFRDKKIISFPKTLIFGFITIKTEAYDETAVKQVEFYFDGKLKDTVMEPVSDGIYTWVCNERSLLRIRHELKVVAIDIDDNTAEDTCQFTMFNIPRLHPENLLE